MWSEGEEGREVRYEGEREGERELRRRKEGEKVRFVREGGKKVRSEKEGRRENEVWQTNINLSVPIISEGKERRGSEVRQAT